MCTILLSIKPEYTDRILAGTKKFEFRRQVAKRHVDRILIYSTAPEMKVVASVAVLGVLKETPQDLWQKTKEFSGISHDKYMEYFSKKEFA
ncbi:MAG: ASCH domain-containing protein, partial [Alphaproteobacteria bacterium]|nr:ASCH domain-containing protein [Alphaproteobacteria bacterium]